ncbi:methyltransferase domain-containing protein [Streptomyces sp. NPDC005931]|uniref:methyltransferase domain-containing protein n=1 Tax=Streptomyces sp. NPDC005931 TaxID=3364737 RepID=UPI0036A81F62
MVSVDHGQSSAIGAGLLDDDVGLLGDEWDASWMPGHPLFPARLGTRVPGPGGTELTRWMLDALGIGPGDRVVELAAGLGAAASHTLARGPAAYTAVDHDPAAVAALSVLAGPGPTAVRAVRSGAAATGLADGSATVVYGEGLLTMRPDSGKQRVVREARRLLTGAGGRYALHELCLLPDGLDPAHAERIRADLAERLHVDARPLTASGWHGLLASEGFTVTARNTAPPAPLRARRLVADKGLGGALRVTGRTLRDPVARRRVLGMRRVLHRHRDHLGAISLVAAALPPAP